MKYLKENGELKVSRAWNLGITCLCFVSVHLSVFVYFHFPPVWTAAEWWRSCFSNPCFLCSLPPPVFDLSFDSRRRKHKKSFGPILPFSFPPAIFCLSCDAGILLAKSTVCAFDTKRRYKSPRNFEFREIQNFDAKQVKNSGFRVDLVDKTRAA